MPSKYQMAMAVALWVTVSPEFRMWLIALQLSWTMSAVLVVGLERMWKARHDPLAQTCVLGIVLTSTTFAIWMSSWTPALALFVSVVASGLLATPIGHAITSHPVAILATCAIHGPSLWFMCGRGWHLPPAGGRA